MFRRGGFVIACLWGTSSLLLLEPTFAQFGLGKNKAKKSTSFQDLQEQALNEQKGINLDDLGDMKQFQNMWENALKDPQMMEMMTQMGNSMNDAMEQIAKMPKEEVEKTMQEAFKMLTETDIVDSVVDKKDAVLETLQASGMVSDEEIQKFKKDPRYFELKMRESFEEMKGLFNDPDMLKAATEMVTGMQQVFKNPEMITEWAKALETDLSSDEKIEQARLQLLKDPAMAGNPMLTGMFESDEMQKVLKDSSLWREKVQEGRRLLKEQGAGVGEL